MNLWTCDAQRSIPEASGRAGWFDADAFRSALDGVRRSRSLSWKRVASESRLSASTLTRVSQGRRPDVDTFAALVTWAGLDSDQFMRSR